ncbi:MAG: hypothetical protein KIT46_06075 [Anaerolineales bacterium]|nr:hypothetical protein [Anaerolineales bacterium]MCW5855600.1 hypothetical protein [Anaerolineales bacterium]
MPRFSVWGIRLALLYFLVGITFGAILLVNKAFPLHPALWALLPLHIDFLLIGWIVQLVFAVAYWIFPRFRSEPKRGRPQLAWAALAALNLSLALLAAASLALEPAWQLPARGLQVAAAGLLAASLWGRAKPTETGKALRDAAN